MVSSLGQLHEDCVSKNMVPLCFPGYIMQIKCVNCFSITTFKSKNDFLVMFFVWPICFVWGEFVFTPTAPYIVHLLKVHCNFISLGKLCK